MDNKYALGIHIGHDRSVSIIKNGELIGHLAQERIDRIKHSHSPNYPYEAIECLLKKLRLKISDIQSIGVSYSHVEIPQIKSILKEEFFEKYSLKDNTGFYGVSHHLSHAESTFSSSGFGESLILVADGSGDFVGDKLESESLYFGNANGIRLLERRLQDSLFSYVTRKNFYIYPFMNDGDKFKQISLGRKYEQLTYMLGFGWGQAGKTMGLASYGKSPIEFPHILMKHFNFDLNLKYLLEDIYTLQQGSSLSFYRYIQRNKADIAKTAQDFIENYSLALIDYIQGKYPHENLCLAGGLFLNCVLNHKILAKTKFKRLFIIPAAGDDGQSIGAAYAAYKMHFKQFMVNKDFSPFLGLKYSDNSILKALEAKKLYFEKLTTKQLVNKASKALSQGKIVGLLRGKSECGPRALCHRSILANPTLKGTKRLLNKKVKFREMFRPYAPVIVAEKQFDYFNLKADSPFMLYSTSVKKKYRRMLPSITHIDGSARVQSISKQSDNFMYALLLNFEKVSGFPILLNTSFNTNNEPIVESPLDAISTFLRTEMDFLIIENYWIEKIN